LYAGTAVYVAIVLLAALLPAAAVTFSALNGLGFLFFEDQRAYAIGRCSGCRSSTAF
jgi:hypothetical protein